MRPDDWFDLLRQRLQATADPPSAAEPGAPIAAEPGAPIAAEIDAPSAAEIDALLDLARVAAHTSERWTAPVSGFLAGVAFADLDADRRAARLRALADDLEADEATSS
jgi:hypothetical protein